MPVVVNRYGYREDHCISLRECRQLLRYHAHTNYQQAEVLFRSIRELCRLTPGADRVHMNRMKARDGVQQKLNRMYNYLGEVYDIVDELEWGRANQERWRLTDIAQENNGTQATDLTQRSVQTNASNNRSGMGLVNESQQESNNSEGGVTVDNTNSVVTANSHFTDSSIGQDIQRVNHNNVTNLTHDFQQLGLNNNNNVTSQPSVCRTSTPIRQVQNSMSGQQKGDKPNVLWSPDLNQWVMVPSSAFMSSPQMGLQQMPIPLATPLIQSPELNRGFDMQNVQQVNNTNSNVMERMVEQQRQQQKDLVQMQLFSQVYEKLNGLDHTKYKSWAESVQKRIYLSKADDEVALSHIRVCLEGNALMMYENATDNVKNSVIETWRFLENRFGEKRCAAVRESTFLTCDQLSNMNIRQYLVELESRCFLTRDNVGYDTVMLQRMSTGLKEHNQRVMATDALLMDSRTRLDDLVKAIEIRENSLKIQNAQFRQIQSATGHTNRNPYYRNKTSNGQNEDSGGNTRPYCTYCQKMGHIVIECDKKVYETRHKDYDHGASGTQGQNNVAKGGYSSFQGQNRPMTPSTQHMNMGAQRSGYQNRSNTQIRETFSGTCNKCQQVGHKFKDCPKRDNMVNMVRNCQGQATDQVTQEGKCGNDDESEDGGGQMMMIVQDHNQTVTTEVSPAETVMTVQAKEIDKTSQEKVDKMYLVVNGELLMNDRYLLDTGASGNMIGLKYVKMLQEKGLIDQKQSCLCNFEGFTGAKVVCLGKHRLSVSLAGKPSYHADFHVTPHLEARNYDIVLGRNALQEMGVKLMCDGMELNMNLVINGHVVDEKEKGKVTVKNKKKRGNQQGKKIGLAQVDNKSVDKQPNWKKGTGGHVTTNHESFHCYGVKSVNEIVNSRISTDQSHRKFSCKEQTYSNNECWFPGKAAKSDYYGYGKQVKMKNSNMRQWQSRHNWQRDNSEFRRYRSCYSCGEQGHIQRNCPFKMKQFWVGGNGDVEHTYE